MTMVTRTKEKNILCLYRAKMIILRARKRAVGQAYKDDGRRFTKPTKISYSKRERKSLDKIIKKVGKDRITQMEQSPSTWSDSY